MALVCAARPADAGALLLQPPSSRLPEMPVWRRLSQVRRCEATLLRNLGHTKSTYASCEALGVRTLLAIRSRLLFSNPSRLVPRTNARRLLWDSRSEVMPEALVISGVDSLLHLRRQDSFEPPSLEVETKVSHQSS